MRVRQQTDENVQIQTSQRPIQGIIGKPTGTVKENVHIQAQGVAVRPLVGKVIGGLKGGARRAALGELSNANQATLTQNVIFLWLTLLIADNNIENDDKTTPRTRPNCAE